MNFAVLVGCFAKGKAFVFVFPKGFAFYCHCKELGGVVKDHSPHFAGFYYPWVVAVVVVD